MTLKFINRVSQFLAIGAILLNSVSCIEINEHLGEDFIPTNQKWKVTVCDTVKLKKTEMKFADKLSGYSSSRITFGSTRNDLFGTNKKTTSFTLVPIADSIDLGEDYKIREFRITAHKDTLSSVNSGDENILQNIYVYSLKEALDSNVLYLGDDIEKYIDRGRGLITSGIPVYKGGDSLSFKFSNEFAADFAEKLKNAKTDSISNFLKSIPGIYIETDNPVSNGGRINMFDLTLEMDSYYYITGNYAELKFSAKFNKEEEYTDTSIVFMLGASDFYTDTTRTTPSQYAFNASYHESPEKNLTADTKTALYVEGGGGVKPVVKASEIKAIIDSILTANNVAENIRKKVVINKATLRFPFKSNSSEFKDLDKYPYILSPTVRLVSSTNEKYISYAGLTDSSVETENQGDINRSQMIYSPDISHHVQQILNYKETEGSSIDNYDIWLLIMSEEVVKESNNSSYDDYYNNLMYNSYYNNMMYDPYGYGGYGYGGYGYGYGGYGYGYGDYGYNNYYNYLMMASYASASSSSETVSIELDRDRYYCAILNGSGSTNGGGPELLLTYSIPAAE